MQPQNFEWTTEMVKEFATKYNSEAPIKYVNGIDKYLQEFIVEKSIENKEYEILEIRIPELNISSTSKVDIFNYFQGKFKSAYITSIKRLSDNEVFHIGKMVIGKGIASSTIQKGKISSFYLNKESRNLLIVLDTSLNSFLLSSIKPFEPLNLKTFDEIEVKNEEQIVYCVTTKFGLTERKAKNATNTEKLVFAIKENAESYIRENKKRFSLKDIESAYKVYATIDSPFYDKFTNELNKIK